jgi:hypothetical protein
MLQSMFKLCNGFVCDVQVCAIMSTHRRQHAKKACKIRPSKKQQKLRDQPNKPNKPNKPNNTAVNQTCNTNTVQAPLDMHEWSNKDANQAGHVGILGGILASFAEYDKQQWRESPEGQHVLNEFLDSIQFKHTTVVYDRCTLFAPVWESPDQFDQTDQY